MAPDIRSIYAQAVEHHQAGRLDAAVASYRQLLALKPDLAGAHYNLGNALYGQAKLKEAEACYRQALRLQPGLANAHNNLGIILFEGGRLDEAVACYRQALVLEPDYAEALNNLGAALCRQEALEEGEACIRRALALKPNSAGAHDNLGSLLWDQGRLEEAEAGFRRAFALVPDFPAALVHLGDLLRSQDRLEEAITMYRQLLQIRPGDIDGLSGFASVQAARGDAVSALDTILHALRTKETVKAKRCFVDIVKQIHWTNDNAQARHAMSRALTEPWARPSELDHAAAGLLKKNAEIDASVARAVKAWPGLLAAPDLFGPNGLKALAADELLLAMLGSAQNTDVDFERFLTMARHALLEAAERDDADCAGPEFYAALARQCFINEYVFYHGAEEIRRATALRDFLADALDTGTPVSPLRLIAVAAYFPLHSLSGAKRLLERAWPGQVNAILLQQVREPQTEAQLRTAIPRMTTIADRVSRQVQNQYEENPYPRWVRMPSVETAATITAYLRRKFPLAPFQQGSGGDITDFLSAGCGTGQLALEIAQGVATRVLAVDLSLASLGYAKRKAQELGLSTVSFAQADLLELQAIGRTFDVVECSGVLHHMADPFDGWRRVLSVLRPGGFMLVGLYSETGRRGIIQARRYIAERGYGTSAEDIRRCRQDLLDLDKSRELGTGFGDFFGVSSCRDLLFHVQEQQIRLPAIATFLQDNGLTFLGFETDNATLQDYRRRFPHDLAATNLHHWNAFETDNPDAFSRMYVFWIQKNRAV